MARFILNGGKIKDFLYSYFSEEGNEFLFDDEEDQKKQQAYAKSEDSEKIEEDY